MSDFYGALESTSFRVRDKEAFLTDPDTVWLKQHAEGLGGFFDEDADGYFAFGWEAQYPSPVITRWNEEKNEDDELSLDMLIQRHITPGDVCQIGVSGAERLRYIGGILWWITSRGLVFMDAQTEWGTKLTTVDLVGLGMELTTQIEEVMK